MLASEFEVYFQKVPCLQSHFIGVFSIDNFPKNIKMRSFLVCNMSKSSEEGTHWITILKSEPRTLEIFDSLGTKINSLAPYLKNLKGNPAIIYNENAFQSSTSNTCGFFTIMFIIERCLNFDLKYKELLAEIFERDVEINEKVVVDFCKNL
jgi:hypothetical protein